MVIGMHSGSRDCIKIMGHMTPLFAILSTGDMAYDGYMEIFTQGLPNFECGI
jgi:hypothetical protein